MAFDLTAADPLMKIHFAPRIEKQFNTAAVLYNKVLPGRGIPVSNRGYEIPVHTAPNPDFAWFDDGGALPAGGGQDVQRSLALYKRFALAVQFTGDALDATNDDAVAYARALAFNIRNATIDAIKYLNIYSFLDGTGFLGKSGETKSLDGLGITLDVSGAPEGTTYLRKKMLLDIHSGVSSTVRGTVRIVSVDSATQITVDKVSGTDLANQTTADGFAIVGSFNKTMSGLDTLIDDANATVQGIDRTTVTEWKANVISLTGSPALARDHLRRAIAQIQINLGEVKLGNLEVWSHPSQLQAYADLGWPLKRFMGGSAKKMDVGYTAYEWEGIPWIIDTDAPKDDLFFLNLASLFKVTARPLGFDDRTGNVLRQVPSSTAGRYDDKFVAYLVARMNMGVYVPRSNTKVKGLAIPTGY